MSDKVKDILEWILCIVVALVLAFLFRFYIATPTVVQHKSMYPTLIPGDRLILNRTFRITNKKPEVGDIVTFEAPINGNENFTTEKIDQSNPVAKFKTVEGLFTRFFYYKIEVSKISYIKRVIATEGQHVVIKDNKVIINGNVLDESKYLSSDVVTTSDVYNDFIVPEGHVFCMGDNRTQSIDCRVFGCIPYDKIEGIVKFRFWPFDKWGSVE